MKTNDRDHLIGLILRDAPRANQAMGIEISPIDLLNELEDEPIEVLQMLTKSVAITASMDEQSFDEFSKQAVAVMESWDK